MTRHHRFIAAALSITFSIGAVSRAQDVAAPEPNPFGDPAAPPALNQPQADAPVASDGAKLPGAPPIPTRPDPAVDTIVDSNPQTPAQFLRAAALLADLARPDLAKQFLQRLAAAQIDEAALADAAAQLEPQILLRLAANEALLPEGRQLADAALAAYARRIRDPQRLQAEIDNLANPSLGVRRQALVKILAAHEDGVPALVWALSDRTRARVHPAARQALVRIWRDAVPPLIAALESDDPELRVQIIDVLGQIGSRDAVLYLAAPATAESSPPQVREAAGAALSEILGVQRSTREDAVALLTAEIDRYLNRKRPLETDADGNVVVWRWNAAAGVPVRETLPAAHASAAIAARLAGDLLQLEPNNRLARRLFLVSTLDEAVYRAGFDNALPRDTDSAAARAAEFGPAAVEDALAFAMSTGHLPAATAAAKILGAIGDRSLLDAKGPELRPLVLALSQGDRRLKFAAAEAIMKFKPTTPFAGSSSLMETLVYLADSPGIKRALVAFPTEAVATQLAAMLRPMGYEVDISTGGHKAYLQAISSGDYELLLLTSRLDHPPLWVVLQQLRREPRSAVVPIALLAEEAGGVDEKLWLESLVTVEGRVLPPLRGRIRGDVLDGDTFTTMFERPFTPEGMKFHVERFVNRASGHIVPRDLRAQQALAALEWLKQLNAVAPREFDLRPFEAAVTRAFRRPLTSAAAADLLAAIGNHSAQTALLSLANDSLQPLPLRQSAASAFSRAVRQWGIQLTSAELENQYDRYNQSVLEDRATQELLGLILDSIEAPTKR